jgi:hypothetical protein
MAFISHKGQPCHPPIVDGVTFRHVKGHLWAGECSDEKAEHLARIPAYAVLDSDPWAAPAPKAKAKAKAKDEEEAPAASAPEPAPAPAPAPAAQ